MSGSNLSDRILIICKGNICRSPLAAEILRQEAGNIVLTKDLEIRSRATEDYHVGKRAHHYIFEIAKKNGYDLSNHIARQVGISDIEWADLIIVMDRSNLERLLELFGESIDQSKVYLLMHFVDGKSIDVLDPYKKSHEHFQNAFSMIKIGCEHFLKYLITKRV